MKCPSCGRQRDLESCAACGMRGRGRRPNGDIGFQINLGKRVLRPAYVYSGDRLRKAGN